VRLVWVRTLFAIALAMSPLLSLSSLSVAQTPTAGQPLPVVASTSVIGDLVHNVGGDAIQLTTLIGPGVDAHTFDPAPADLVTLDHAAVVFENGLGLEPWLDQFFESTQPAGKRVVVTEGIEPLPAGAEGAESTDEHAQGASDPHVWHDVANAIVMVENIRQALDDADPAHAATYDANAAAYMAELQALDSWVREQVATLPPERRKLVTNHDTLAYFANAYGFEILGTALGSISTEVGDPSAQKIVALVGEIDSAGVCAIFAENVANPDLMDSIAAEAGVVLAPPLYTDALGPPDSPGGTYVGMMRSNVTTIVEALNSC
jgi:zinc/manganese transport system substrate-binding protein